MNKSAKRLLGVVFTLAMITILACGAFAAKPAIESIILAKEEMNTVVIEGKAVGLCRDI